MIYNAKVSSYADAWAPKTELQSMLYSHGMDVEPVYVMRSNPISLICLEGRCSQVFSVLTANRDRPVEHAIAAMLQDTYVIPEQIPQERPSAPTAWRRSAQFQLVNTSISAMRRVAEGIGGLFYTGEPPAEMAPGVRVR